MGTRGGSEAVAGELAGLADPDRAAGMARYFKTGAGEYGEGDVFLGVTVPRQRAVARRHRNLDLAAAERLLRSEIHEHRLTALFILVDRYRRAGPDERARICALYLANTRRIDNWDLVDASAPYIVGPQLDGTGTDGTGTDGAGTDRAGTDGAGTDGSGLEALLALAGSPDVWERRIAMLACFHGIKQGRPATAFAVIDILEHDPHGLIHKAVGWMLREVGKRCGRDTLEAWLLARSRYRSLPRTTLRYAIEHFEPERRAAYLTGRA